MKIQLRLKRKAEWHMSLPINKNTENGMRTYFFLDKDTHNPMVRVTCETSGGSKLEYIVPVTNMNYWYPLYHVFDYKYQAQTGEMHLVLYPEASEEQINQFDIIATKVQRYVTTSIILPSIINPKTGTVTDNELHRINQSLLFQLEKRGITTWNKKNYTRQDVKRNYDIINETLKAIKVSTQLKYHTKKGDESNTVFSFDDLSSNLEARDIDYYKYLSDDDARVLIELGGAYTMTTAMNKILKLTETE